MAKTPKPIGIVSLYLILYNLASSAGWGYCLYLLTSRMFNGLASLDLTNASIEQVVEQALNVAGGSFQEFGQVVKYVQTGALLEVLHVLLGLVRSSVMTTAMQVSSRIVIVWYVCEQYPQVADSPIYSSMILAWSFTEVVRYTHYATGLMNISVNALEWLRYSTFYLLYPIGAGSEAALIYFSANHASVKFGAIAGYATYLLVCIWPPALLMMMSYMHNQRSKHVNPKKVHAKKSIPAAPIPVSSTTKSIPKSSTPTAKSTAVADFKPRAATPPAATLLVDPLEGTPSRSTRSRSKQPL